MEQIKKNTYVIAVIAVVLIGGLYFWHSHSAKKTAAANKAKTSQNSTSTPKTKSKKNSTSQDATTAPSTTATSSSTAKNATPSTGETTQASDNTSVDTTTGN